MNERRALWPGEPPRPGEDCWDDETDEDEASTLLNIAQLRRRLWEEGGYRPVPLLSASDPDPRRAGKSPIHRDWQLRARKNPPEAAAEPALEHLANTGILCDGLRAVDTDVDDPERAEQIDELRLKILGPAPVRSRPNSPRFCALYAAADGEPPKVKIDGTTGDPEHPEKVEILGRGQQIAAHGTHVSGVELRWNVEPLDMPRHKLPRVTEAQIAEFLEAIAPIIGAKAPTRRKSNPAKAKETNGAAAPGLAGLAEALTLIPAEVADDYDAWIRVGAALYHETAGSEEGMLVWADWAKKSDKFDDGETEARWASFAEGGSIKRVSGATIFRLAVPYGWRPADPTDDEGYRAALEAAAREEANRAGARRSPQDEPPTDRFPEDEPAEQKPNGVDPDKPVLCLRYGFEATAARPLGTVVEGLLHAGSVTLIYGPPKSGKSFLATDLALSIAANEPEWMGHKIVRPGPVLYIACEGFGGFWKRLSAAAKQRGWDEKSFPPDFILATGRPMLIRADARGLTYAPDPSSVLAALREAKQRGLAPVAIIVDTVFRSFGAGNVNASPDMNVYLAAVAAVTDEGIAVALVHHEVKAGGTPAGSVSLIGGTDTIVHVWRDAEGARFWQVEMAKDDAETAPRAFTLDVVSIGVDPDGRPASSCVINDAGAAPDATPTKKRGRQPAEGSNEAILASLIYDELCNLLAYPAECDKVAIRPGMGPIRAVKRTILRGTLIQAGILEPVEDEAERKRVNQRNRTDVNRAIKRLTKRGKVIANEQWIGLAD